MRCGECDVLNALLTWQGLLAVLFGYLLGSIPFGLLLTRAAGLGDVRSIGSGNIGATNVLRTGNKGLAAATLLLDALKAAAAVWIVRLALRQPEFFAPNWSANDGTFWLPILAGVAAVVGHIYPVWLGFKGGKGVATYIGALVGIFWQAAVLFCLVWLAVAALFRMSSLAALVACAAPILYALYLGNTGLALLLALMTALIFYKHEANFRRLLAGEEPKIGEKK